jgi:hypothetical protein
MTTPIIFVNTTLEYGKGYVSLTNYSSNTIYNILGSTDGIIYGILASNVSGNYPVDVPISDNIYYIKASVAGIESAGYAVVVKSNNDSSKIGTIVDFATQRNAISISLKTPI